MSVCFLVGRLIGLSCHNFLKWGGKLRFRAPIRSVVSTVIHNSKVKPHYKSMFQTLKKTVNEIIQLFFPVLTLKLRRIFFRKMFPLFSALFRNHSGKRPEKHRKQTGKKAETCICKFLVCQFAKIFGHHIFVVMCLHKCGYTILQSFG